MPDDDETPGREIPVHALLLRYQQHVAELTDRLMQAEARALYAETQLDALTTTEGEES